MNNLVSLLGWESNGSILYVRYCQRIRSKIKRREERRDQSLSRHSQRFLVLTLTKGRNRMQARMEADNLMWDWSLIFEWNCANWVHYRWLERERRANKMEGRRDCEKKSRPHLLEIKGIWLTIESLHEIFKLCYFLQFHCDSISQATFRMPWFNEFHIRSKKSGRVIIAK